MLQIVFIPLTEAATVLEALFALMSNTKIVKEIVNKGK